MSYFAKVDLILQERENPNTIVINRDSRRDKLLSKICELYSIGMEDIRSQNRKGNIRDARNLSFYVMYKVLKYTSTFTVGIHVMAKRFDLQKVPKPFLKLIQSFLKETKGTY